MKIDGGEWVAKILDGCAGVVGVVGGDGSCTCNTDLGRC